MSSKKLRERHSSHNQQFKQPTVTVNYDQCKPKFSLEFLQSNYCLSHCEQHEKAWFADAIHKRSQLPWRELKADHRHALGFEIIDQDSIKAAIPRHISADVKLISFRCFGMKPMVGYRKHDTFYVLWLDRNHDLYT